MSSNLSSGDAPDATAGTPQLIPVAAEIGRAWAQELILELRADERDPVGGWPGTLSEAKARVLARLGLRLDSHALVELARVASEAARRNWQSVTQPDPEV